MSTLADEDFLSPPVRLKFDIYLVLPIFSLIYSPILFTRTLLPDGSIIVTFLVLFCLLSAFNLLCEVLDLTNLAWLVRVDGTLTLFYWDGSLSSLGREEALRDELREAFRVPCREG